MPLDSSPGALLRGHREGTEGWSSHGVLQDTFPSGQPLQPAPYLHPRTPAGTSAWEPATMPGSHLLPPAEVRKKKGTHRLGMPLSASDYFVTQSCNFYRAPNATTGTVNSPRLLFRRPFWPHTGLFKIYYTIYVNEESKQGMVAVPGACVQ